MNRPEIQNVEISPNPVNAKNSVKISVQVIDKAIVFGKSTDYMKEIYASQKIGVI